MMNKKTVKKILKKVKDDYRQAGRVRKAIWPEEEALFRYIKNNDHVLDLGCGEGRIIPLLKNKKIHYLGLDNCSALLRIAQETFPNYKFKLGDMTSLKLPQKKFDVVVCLAAFHQIPSIKLRREVLKKIKATLKNGGLLLMTNWNLKNYKKKNKATELEANDFYVPWRNKTKEVKRYYHLFFKKELQNLCQQADFKIIKYRTGRRNIVIIAKA